MLQQKIESGQPEICFGGKKTRRPTRVHDEEIIF